jgi:hypothetical protein
MHCLEVIPVIGWKHDAVELDETVRKVDMHHTGHSLYIDFLVHIVQDVKIKSPL